MIRGREKFGKYKTIINLISNCISIFPLKVRKQYFAHLRNKNGKIGLVLRYATIKTLIKNIGDNVSIHPGVYIFNPENLSIGNNVSIHPMSYIEAYGGIIIGNNVSIAHSVSILSVNHCYQDTGTLINDQGIESRPSVIEDNVWIGAKAVIMGGVIISQGSVLASSSVVTKNFGQNVVLAGVPAKVIGIRGV